MLMLVCVCGHVCVCVRSCWGCRNPVAVICRGAAPHGVLQSLHRLHLHRGGVALPVYLGEVHDRRLRRCAMMCMRYGFRFFGIAEQRHCHCGDGFRVGGRALAAREGGMRGGGSGSSSSASSVSSSMCSYKCSHVGGGSARSCGGPGAASIYFVCHLLSHGCPSTGTRASRIRSSSSVEVQHAAIVANHLLAPLPSSSTLRSDANARSPTT
eukprot:GHVU01220553.1.p1 GENE.GHVU01220553.1~~GHVU01220553.1.p1  ORF type:complete len:211 (+),score=5.12 GHVU01220553.1:10-642(+)